VLGQRHVAQTSYGINGITRILTLMEPQVPLLQIPTFLDIKHLKSALLADKAGFHSGWGTTHVYPCVLHFSALGSFLPQ